MTKLPYDSLRGRRVLVTGGGGFLGRAVCRACVAAGAAAVDAVYRRAKPDPIPDAPATFRTWRVDLTSADAVAEVVRACRPDVVVHAAGFASAARDLAAVGPSVRDNVLASANLLTAAAAAGVRRVVVAGSTESPTGVADVAGVTPSSPYAAGKYAEGCFARMFHQTFGLGVVVARLSVVYGPGERRAAKLVPYVASRLLAGEPAELSSGRRRIDWVYVDDAADGLLACAAAPAVEGQTIDVGTGRLTPIADVAAEIARLVGRPDLLRVGARPDRPDEVEATVDAAATERVTGWRAGVRLEDGLARTVTWLRHRRRADELPGGSVDPDVRAPSAPGGVPPPAAFPSLHA